MHSKKGVLIVLGFCIFILLFIEPVLSEQNNFLNLLSNPQLAESDEKSNIISEVSIIGIITAIVTIIAIATFGGIKYVTPENVLDTEVRKNLYEFINEYQIGRAHV